jgi:hypothetical protein
MPDAQPAGSRLGISPEDFPDGMDLQWNTQAVAGQPMPTHFNGHLKRGWEPLQVGDCGGKYDYFMPPGHKGVIEVDGLVLCTRPKAWSEKAKQQDRMDAANAVRIKEAQLQGGDLEGVTMGGGSRHPNALRFNRINRTVERLDVPNEGVMD